VILVDTSVWMRRGNAQLRELLNAGRVEARGRAIDARHCAVDNGPTVARSCRRTWFSHEAGLSALGLRGNSRHGIRIIYRFLIDMALRPSLRDARH
jgi:hypothetical protein